MITDLVSPWCAAIEAGDSVAAQQLFRVRHGDVLEAVRAARTPFLEQLQLCSDRLGVRRLAARADDAALQQRLRNALNDAASLGADFCSRVVLLAGDGTGDIGQPTAATPSTAALFLDRTADDERLILAVAHVTTAMTRWHARKPLQPSHDNGIGPWDRWRASPEVPLREHIYAAGLGSHVAQALLPQWSPDRLLDLSPTAYARLRQREKVFASLLEADLDQCGLGLLLRWLTPTAAVSMRTTGGIILPPSAGYYLARKMVAPRVARVGLRDALRMDA